MMLGQCAIVPANGPTDWKGIAVDPAGRVVRGGNTDGLPVGQTAKLTQAVRHGAHGSPGLALELAEVQFTDTARCPKVCWKPNLGNHLTTGIEGESLNRTGGKVESRNQRRGTEVTACHVIRLKYSMHGPVGCIWGHLAPAFPSERCCGRSLAPYSTNVASP